MTDRNYYKTFIKVFSYSTVSTVVKMVTGLVTIKLIAILVGPKGVVMLGQLNNFNTIVFTLASGGINFGIIKYISEHKESPEITSLYIKNGIRITILCSLLVGLFMIVFCNYLSRSILLSEGFEYVFIVFGFTIVFYGVNNFYISILSGLQQYKKTAIANIGNNIVGLIFTIVLVISLKLSGVLLSVVTYQSVTIFITLILIYKLPWFSWKQSIGKIDQEIVFKFLRYSIMALVTALTVPLGQLYARSYVYSSVSITAAGYWEGVNRLSGLYTFIITTYFTLYYLPRLSEIKDRIEMMKEVKNGFKVLIPTVIVGFLVFYLLRKPIILITFSRDFLPMQSLFIWQLIGDLFKIATWLIYFIFIAKGQIKSFILTEVLVNLVYVLLTYLTVPYQGAEGAIIAYATTYILTFIFMCAFYKRILKNIPFQ